MFSIQDLLVLAFILLFLFLPPNSTKIFPNKILFAVPSIALDRYWVYWGKRYTTLKGVLSHFCYPKQLATG